MNDFDIHNKSLEFRKRFGEDATSPINIISIVASIPELTVVYYPFSDNISGMCVRGNKNCVIAINSNMSLGRQRFTIAHEMYHYFYDTDLTLTICSKDGEFRNQKEKDADMFASYLLMPPTALNEKISSLKTQSGKLDLKCILAIEQYFQVSRQALLFRLIQLNEFSNEEIEGFKTNIRSSAKQYGYNDDLYRPTPEAKKHNTLGKYVNMANDILEHNEISEGKYEELLLDAFRTDIVFGDNDEEGGFFD